MREKNFKQYIIIIALILFLCSNFLAPSSVVSNAFEKNDEKMEAVPYIFDYRLQQKQSLNSFADFCNPENIQFAEADSAFHSRALIWAPSAFQDFKFEK